VEESESIIPPEVTLVIIEFNDIISEDSPNKLPPMRDTSHAIESDLEEFIYYMDEDVGHEFDDDHEGEEVAHSCIRYAPSTHLLVISSVFSQSEEKDD